MSEQSLFISILTKPNMDMKSNQSLNFNSTNIETNIFEVFSHFLSYISLVIIGCGLIGNSVSFLIFRLAKQMKIMPSMVFLSFICVTDTLS